MEPGQCRRLLQAKPVAGAALDFADTEDGDGCAVYEGIGNVPAAVIVGRERATAVLDHHLVGAVDAGVKLNQVDDVIDFRAFLGAELLMLGAGFRLKDGFDHLPSRPGAGSLLLLEFAQGYAPFALRQFI